MAESNIPARWPAYCRVPPFLPVPLRARADGWTPRRQAEFIGFLAETGSVTEAAQRVGMSRVAAYRLRRCRNSVSFVYAWDAVLAARNGTQIPARKVTFGELYVSAMEGPLTVQMRGGRFLRTSQKPSDTAALRFLKRFGTRSLRRRGRRA